MKLVGDGTAHYMRELFHIQGFTIKYQYTEVNLQRLFIHFDLEFFKHVAFRFDTNLASNLSNVFNFETNFRTSTTIENNDYMRVMLDIDLSGNSYPKLADVITTNTYNLNMRMGILEFNNSGGTTSGRTTSSTGGDMSDYTLITTTDELEATVVALIEDVEGEIATQGNRLTAFETNVVAKIDDVESQVGAVDVNLTQQISDNETRLNEISSSTGQSIQEHSDKLTHLDGFIQNVHSSLATSIHNVSEQTTNKINENKGNLDHAVNRIEGNTRVGQDHTRRLDSLEGGGGGGGVDSLNDIGDPNRPLSLSRRDESTIRFGPNGSGGASNFTVGSTMKNLREINQ